jgi:hypothetical protein
MKQGRATGPAFHYFAGRRMWTHGDPRRFSLTENGDHSIYFHQADTSGSRCGSLTLCGKWNPWHAGPAPACGFFKDECIHQAAASLIKGAS